VRVRVRVRVTGRVSMLDGGDRDQRGHDRQVGALEHAAVGVPPGEGEGEGAAQGSVGVPPGEGEGEGAA